MEQRTNGLVSSNQQHEDTENSPLTMLNQVISDAKKDYEAAKNKVGLFELQSANDVIKEALAMPDPIYLYPQLIQEGEFIILFADTGVGKTIFAFQTAIYIAERGKSVVFLDLELSKKQFQKRYTDEHGVPYKMPDNLFRVGYSREKNLDSSGDYTKLFIDSVKQLLEKTKARVLYIDNLTKLSTGSTDTAKDTIPVLNELNSIQTEYGLTIIAIEHTKKGDPTKPITLNDLQGSKMKANLCDTVLCIGRSVADTAVRYIKQVKVRDSEHIFDSDNVITFEIRRDSGYLSFYHTGSSPEWKLLQMQGDAEKTALIERVKEMGMQGIKQREIARQLNISLGAVNKYLKKESIVQNREHVNT